MKLSISTSITRPDERGDNYIDALKCYSDLADEVVVVNGANRTFKNYHGIKTKNIKTVFSYWDYEFSWPLIGEQFTKGYQATTGDVSIHMDIDCLFHERDFAAIRQAAQNMLDNRVSAMSFWKYQLILPDRYNLKSRLVLMINKRDYGDSIKFDSGGDLCRPSINKEYIDSSSVPESKIAIYNYEKLTKTIAQIMDDVGRMERAYKRHFGKTQYGSDGTDEDAYNKWIEAQKGKFAKPQKHIKLEEHPKFVQETIKNLTPEQFGYSGFGHLQHNDYIR